MTDPATLPSGATALQATLLRLRERPLRQVWVVGLLCAGIALLLTAFRGRGLANHLVFSYSIGIACVLLTHGTRLALAALSDLARRLRGLPASVAGFDSGWRGIVPATLVAVGLGMPLGMAVAGRILGIDSSPALDWRQADGRVTLTLTLLGTGFSVFAISALEKLGRARAAEQAAQRLAAENQLRLLQSQLEPHMLFNTLANLRVLIGMDPARAQAMLDRLIAFLRSTLDASRAAAHPLAAEFERTADYLALMGVRMGPRLAVQLVLPEPLRALPVPPLLLQPLVENAIQHGLEPQVEGGRIEVAARAESGELVLTVRDTGAGLGAGDRDASVGGSHFGLVQVRERLATLHGSRAALTLAPASGGGTLATIRMPLPSPA